MKKEKNKEWKEGRKRSNNSSLFTLITKKKSSSFFSPRTVTDISVLRKNIFYLQFPIYIRVIIFRLRQGILISIRFNYANWDRAWKKNAVWKRERERDREEKKICAAFTVQLSDPLKKECSHINFARQWSTYRLSSRQVLYNQSVLCAADSGQSLSCFLQQWHNRCTGHTVLLASDSGSGSFFVYWNTHMSLMFPLYRKKHQASSLCFSIITSA